MLVNFSFRSSSFDFVLIFVFVFVFVPLVVFWEDFVIFLLLVSFYSFLLLFCLRTPSKRRYSVKHRDWPPYCWEPHKFCNILCSVREVF